MKSLITTLTLATTALTPLIISSCSSSATPSDAIGNIPYPLRGCIVTGKKLDTISHPVVKVYNSQEIKFDSTSSVRIFEANRSRYLRKLDW